MGEQPSRTEAARVRTVAPRAGRRKRGAELPCGSLVARRSAWPCGAPARRPRVCGPVCASQHV